MENKWCTSRTGAGHTCRRHAGDHGVCWQHAKERKAFSPWTCVVCGEVMANLPQMAGKPVSDRQTAYINGLLASREVSRAQAANAKLWLAAAVESQSGRDIAAILIHELLHKEKRSSYQDSYLS